MVKQVQKEAFQLNKQVEEVNLQTETFVAKRIICDHVSYVGGIAHVDVNTSCSLVPWRN